MKKAIGWFLIVGSVFMLVSAVVTIPTLATVEEVALGERVLMVAIAVLFAVVGCLVCWLGFKIKSPGGAKRPRSKEIPKPSEQHKRPMEKWMTSQIAALYVQEGKEAYRKRYITRLEEIGFSKADAQKMFDFERDVISRFPKQYLLEPQYAKSWVFNLKQPFFQQYPKTKEEILQERCLTVSELCKIADEAEWHIWNSHEKQLPDAVWQELCEWRLKGPGAEFATRYFNMIEEVTGIPESSLASLSSEQGRHLSQYKWD